jgi:hypothetical protein
MIPSFASVNIRTAMSKAYAVLDRSNNSNSERIILYAEDNVEDRKVYLQFCTYFRRLRKCHVL